MGNATGLAILDALPPGFLECRARDLHLLLNGPTLIELPGERRSPLFVSILLHGNEDSGLGAVQRVIGNYQGRALPRALMLLVGNVEAARHGVRRLDGQPDYNRIWPGTPDHGHTAEVRIMADVHARVMSQGVLAAIDFHNNTGRNPRYSVVCSLDERTLGLAALFSHRAVYFRGVPGTQTASFTGLITAITAECGLPGEPTNEEAGARFLCEALDLAELPQTARDDEALELYHTLGVVRVKKKVSIGFGTADAELCFDPDLDRHNFRPLSPGTALAETGQSMPLRMIDEAGCDVTVDYFETSGGKLRLRREAVPAMLTAQPDIVRQDCLCYLMERL